MKAHLNYRSVLALLLTLSVAMTAPGIVAQEDEANAKKEIGEQPINYKELKSPIPNTEKSIKRGKTFFVRICAECHGRDGKALLDVVADATNLTNPKLWYNGTTQGEIYRSIREGAGEGMPPYKFELKKEEDFWHLVNFIRSLWPKDVRPDVVEPPEDEDAEKQESGESETP